MYLEKAEYIQKINELLSDNNVYKEIKEKPLNKLQNDVYKILNNFNGNNFLKHKYHTIQLTQTDTQLAKCYGLPKIHKPTLSFRPIISTVNSPTHHLAKVIYKNLKSCFPSPRSHIDNSVDLIKKLKNIKIPDGYTLVSLDVVSLFTNVSLNLVIQSLEKRASNILNNCKIPFSDIINSTKFLFENIFFTFNNRCYQQMCGTPMGSLISPFFADLVLEDLEVFCWNRLKIDFSIIPIFISIC